MRYYHVFEEGELEKLVGLVEGLQVSVFKYYISLQSLLDISTVVYF